MINLFLGVYRPSRTTIDVNGVQEMPSLQQYQENPFLEIKLHENTTVAKRQGYSSEVYIESRFWWETYFTAFEAKLPLALRYTYQYFDLDVSIPTGLSVRDSRQKSLETSNYERSSIDSLPALTPT